MTRDERFFSRKSKPEGNILRQDNASAEPNAQLQREDEIAVQSVSTHLQQVGSPFADAGNSTEQGNKESSALNAIMPESLTNYDILFGKSHQSSNTIGNRRFQILIEMNVQKYIDATSRRDKASVIQQVVTLLHEQIGAKFYRRKAGGTSLEQVTDKSLIRHKVGHSLRKAVREKERRERYSPFTHAKPDTLMGSVTSRIATQSIHQLAVSSAAALGIGDGQDKQSDNKSDLKLPRNNHRDDLLKLGPNAIICSSLSNIEAWNPLHSKAPGNQTFRSMIEVNLQRYRDAGSKTKRRAVVNSMIRELRSESTLKFVCIDEHGRFEEIVEMHVLRRIVRRAFRDASATQEGEVATAGAGATQEYEVVAAGAGGTAFKKSSSSGSSSSSQRSQSSSDNMKMPAQVSRVEEVNRDKSAMATLDPTPGIFQLDAIHRVTTLSSKNRCLEQEPENLLAFSIGEQDVYATGIDGSSSSSEGTSAYSVDDLKAIWPTSDDATEIEHFSDDFTYF